jgi:peptide chain release factor 2
MYETKKTVEELLVRFQNLEAALQLPAKRKRIEVLRIEASAPNLWDNQDKAREITQELADLASLVDDIDSMSSEIKALSELATDDSLHDELDKDIANQKRKLGKIELQIFLSGRYDKKNAILSIHAGQGGTEAMDWSSMLMRMYMRFFERRGWKYEVLEETQGEEAGVKSISFKVSGQFAYGYLKREAGTHRLVRQSPFNADKLRQTSFALVEVLPELSEIDLPDIVINPEDLDIQFYRSGGHGGQNVNKVSTAVRLVHKPTGLTVTAQTERSQEQNRKNAMDLLRTKLWAKRLEEAHEEKSQLQGDYSPATWGTQIRSYVLHPYKMVKDLRTDIETSNTDAVLDGDLDEFIEAEIKLE